MFIFGDYLRVMDHEANTNQMTMPPNPWRTGDLSGAATTIYDPNTGNPLDGTGRTPFPGNQIPIEPHQSGLGEDYGVAAFDERIVQSRQPE